MHDTKPILLEVWPGVWITLGREHYLWPRLQLLAPSDGRISHSVLTTMRAYKSLSRFTDEQINIAAWNILRPAVQHFGEELAQ